MGRQKTVQKKLQPYEIGELDQYLFGQGTHYEIFRKMGAHKAVQKKQEGVYFAVWAPHAARVSVVGEFNAWDFGANEMHRQEPLGIYTCFVPGAQEGDLYKFCIETQTGERIFKADPFANYAERRPGTASRVTDISNLKWSDEQWMQKQKSGIKRRIRWRSMRYIWAPGCVIRAQRMRDFIPIVNLLIQLRIM